MDMAGPEADMPMPISSNYGGIHEQVKLRFVGSGNGTPTEEIRSSSQDQGKSKKTVRYRECQKNHAASIGGHAIDGCGEFMPSGEEGTLDSLRCAACDCHRNFHRREVEGESSSECPHARKDRKRLAPQLILPPGAPGIIHSGGPVASRAPGSGAILMPYGSGMSESEEHEGAYMPSPPSSKKRFRTKFTQDQKDKMLVFAEKLGWKIQKHDEADVQQFCSETGVKRHVLKVWMHNNKNTLGKKE